MARKRSGEYAAIEAPIIVASAFCPKAYDATLADVKERQLRAFRAWYGRWAYRLTDAERRYLDLSLD